MPTPIKLTTPIVSPISARRQSRVTAPSNAATSASRNVTDGPVDLLAMEIDNMQSAANTKMWVKLFDDATSAWTPGTTKPVLIVPVLAVVVAADASTRGDGFVSVYCIEGYPFDEGISVSASQEDGDESAAASGANDDLIVELIHRSKAAINVVSAPQTLLAGLRTMEVGGGKETLRALIGGSDNTSQDDIFAAAATVYRVRINATQNPAEDVYVRLFDVASPTVGTTDAEMLLPCKKGRDYTWEFPRGIPFGTALSVATVKDKGATSGNSAPTGIVDVVIDMSS